MPRVGRVGAGLDRPEACRHCSAGTAAAGLACAGFQRSQSEALATALYHAATELVTKDELAKALDAQVNKLTLRLSAVTAALLALAVTFSKIFA